MLPTGHAVGFELEDKSDVQLAAALESALRGSRSSVAATLRINRSSWTRFAKGQRPMPGYIRASVCAHLRLLAVIPLSAA